MDFVLIAPPNSRYYSASASQTPEYSCPPLGLLYLAAALRREGHEVSFIDMDGQGTDDTVLQRLVEERRPKIAGITSTTPSFPNALKVAERVKRASPGTHVVLGGSHVTARPAEALSHSSVDIVVRGEGEQTLVELGRYLLEQRRELAGVAGISFKRSDGRIHHNVRRRPVEDLDSLPYPARSLVDAGAYAQGGAMITSRGCMRRCVFCACGLAGTRTFRLRGARAVVDEMAHVTAQYGVMHFEFHDDAFTADAGRALEMCRLIRQQPALDGARWGCQALASAFDEELARSMADAGCRCVQFGIESGNDGVLAKTGKGISTAQAADAIRAATTAGIPTIVASFIIGLPWDTPDTVQETADFALRLRELGATHTPCSVLTPFPGTPIGEDPKRFGVRILSDDWERYTFNQVLIETEHFSAEELRKTYAAVIFDLVEAQSPAISER